MTDADLIDAVLGRGRTAAEARMRDTCRITRTIAQDERAMNPETLAYDDPWETVYEGRCRIGRDGAPTAATAEAGDAAWSVQDAVLHLPLSAATEDVSPGDTVEYLIAADNAAMAGRRFGVIAVLNASQTTARRCRIREVVSS